ncbi:MAG: hypothetical protein AAF423_11375 [Pseudomonadota bacterium]
MANFDGLIRGALAAKDASSPETRQRVYQSSRNALKRLIDDNRYLTLEAALKEQRALEDAINRIEQEYLAPQTDNPLYELQQILSDGPNGFPPAARQQKPEPVVVAEPPQPAPEMLEPVQDELPENTVPRRDDEVFVGDTVSNAYQEHENLPLEFAKRRKTQKRIRWLVGILFVLVALAWLAYYILTGISDGSLFDFSGNTPAQNANSQSAANESQDYITILEPGDLSSLVTANRGQAEIINELNLEMIRLASVRNSANRSEPAAPILLRLKPGVLEQISGKNVTFEIYAKSGTASPAQFTVKCQFGDLGNCGRKRFRIGLQPEASIFAFQMATIGDTSKVAYIAINTDTTEGASVSGKGDVIDIVYARLRAN